MQPNLAALLLSALLFAQVTTGCASTEAQVRAASGAYAQVNGLNMYYEVHGPASGRPLVLLHGGGSTIDTSFGRLIPMLARDHRLIAVEQQAHGHTADVDRPLSFEQMADDTAALLQQLHVQDADIMGFSNGGVIAMQIALRHRPLVHSLILASTYFKHDGCYSYMWEGFPTATLDVMPKALRDAYLQVSPQGEAGLMSQFHKTVAMMMSFKDLDEGALRAISAPVLVLSADGDVIRPEHAVEMLRVFPHAQLALFPGAIHGGYIRASESGDNKAGSRVPELTAAMIHEFLNEAKE
ncbi:alpha/beta hydrolase [Corallococcus sp. H22C18031201]|nr:alpha/beta hydrolase [Corallococcus sp. H22C18031201]